MPHTCSHGITFVSVIPSAPALPLARTSHLQASAQTSQALSLSCYYLWSTLHYVNALSGLPLFIALCAGARCPTMSYESHKGTFQHPTVSPALDTRTMNNPATFFFFFTVLLGFCYLRKYSSKKSKSSSNSCKVKRKKCEPSF